SAATAGVDYRALLAGSSHARQVRALYRTAGLDLDADLAALTRDADIRPDARAIGTLARTSMATGRLRVPVLNIHTTFDQLVPVEQEDWYAGQVHRAGRGPLLRQAYVGTTGHCAFRPSESIAALRALESRVESGRWDDVAEPARLNEAAAALGEAGR
ncbi:alpha/beta hydrolase, partial [Amycolatopsis sp. SID8362]|nr:alpha/beta hydrolase [Amycolatopsis sp. SID8362]NED48722.1 alpha/beta hydrolase [Amycolatopsis sp. SID8362]